MAVDGGETLGRAPWGTRSAAVADSLSRLGVDRGTRVAIACRPESWIDLAVAYAALRSLGATVIPLAPRFGLADFDRIMAHSQPAVVIGRQGLQVSCAPAVSVAALEAGTGDLAQPRSGANTAEDAGGELLYPTGTMRPAVTTRRTWSELASAPAVARRERLFPDTGPFLHCFPMATVAAQDALLAALDGRGWPMIAAPCFDPGRFLDLARRYRPASCGVSGVMARLLCQRTESLVPVAGVGTLTVVTRRLPDAVAAGLRRLFPEAQIEWRDDEPDAGPVPGWESGPISGAQGGMVWHEQFTPGSFNLAPMARRYRGRLDTSALRRALDGIVNRHGALRTNFTLGPAGGRQIVAPPGSTALAVIDLSYLEPNERLVRVAEILAEARARPFDLTADPLFQPILMRLADDDHVLAVRAHHSVFDDWSVGVFRRELSVLYNAFSQGEPSPLLDAPPQLAAFASAQGASVEGPRGQTQRHFWKNELSGAPLAVQLDIAAAPGSADGVSPVTSIAVSSDLAGPLRSLAQAERSSLFGVLLSVFAIVVGERTGLDDLVFSTLTANRNQTELESAIGCFGKKIPVRLRLDGNPTFVELLRRSRGSVLRALAHQDLAFESVVQASLGAGAAANGLCPRLTVKFQSAISAPGRLALNGLSVGPVESPTPVQIGPAVSLHDLGERRGAPAPPWGDGVYHRSFLGVSVVEAADGLSLVAEGLYDLVKVETLLQDVIGVLAAVAANPESRLVALRPGGRVAAPGTTDFRGFCVDLERVRAILAEHPAVAEASVFLESSTVADTSPIPDGQFSAEGSAAPRLLAVLTVKQGGPAPTARQLRTFFWARWPGGPWPAEFRLVRPINRGGSGNSGKSSDAIPHEPLAAGTPLPEELFLRAAWAEVVGAEGLDPDGFNTGAVEPDACYWQSFSFLDVLALAEAGGKAIPPSLVLANRSLSSLATALASRALGPEPRP